MTLSVRAVQAERFGLAAGRLLRVLAVTIAGMTAASCAGTTPEPILALPVKQAPAPSTQASLRTMLMSQAQPDVLAFYQQRDFKPAWSGGKDDAKTIADVRATLGKANEHGLRNADYVLPNAATSGPGDDAARYDIALTTVVLRYAREVHTGRFKPKDIHSDVLLPTVNFDAAWYLNRAIDSGSPATYLAELAPSHPEYRRLVKALAHYRAIAEEGGWSLVPGNTEIRLDRNDERLDALVKRLTFEDAALDGKAKPSRNDIRDAVKRFQARNGLDDDGIVGPETIAALNVPAAVRVAQIAANMERWRWLPPQFESRYIAVNIPDQSVQYIQDGKPLLTSKVVVGRKTSASPIIRTEIKTVVVNPPWNIPGDIAARDLLPHLKRNANYLATRNMVVMDGPPGDPRGRTIKWRDIRPAEFPYAIRQLPGPRTALGAIMLDSPNDFDVYLHDTPNKKLFDLTSREISNGCIRVEQIFPLASLVMTGDAKEGLDELNKVRRTRQTQRLPLDNPVPVYFLYWTAMANEDGSVDFRPDRYGRDTALIAALARGSAVAPTRVLEDTEPGEELNPIGGEMPDQDQVDAADLAP
jgi:murein L,D-transpeptidase YcbB/YkuD